MSRRVAIGNFGSNFLFRVSKAGHDAVTGALSEMILHEQLVPIVPVETGTVAVASNSSIKVTLNRTYDYMPFIVLRSQENMSPSPYSYLARLDKGTPTLTVYNYTGLDYLPAQTYHVEYFIFDRVNN